MTPSDLTSAVGTIPLQVAIDDLSAAVGVESLAPIAAEIGLVSWPEGDPVQVTTALEEFDPRRENGFQVFGSGKITVTPGAPPRGALVLPVPRGDAGCCRSRRRAADAEARGWPRRCAIHDRVGSGVTWVRRCLGDGGTSGKVVVDFSETVVLDSAEALTVEASGACTRPISGERDGISIASASRVTACPTTPRSASLSPIRLLG